VLASALEITFTLLVGGVTILAGLFGLYVLIQLFRNPSRR
jgi:ABC-type phosphate transport system permease subunit